MTRADRLTDLQPLGEGGYGLVYKAQHTEWGLVAYKTLHAQFIKEKDEIKLKHEAEIHSQLNHPNIVKFLALVFEPGQYGLVLEYMACGEILDYIQEYNPHWKLKLSMIRDLVLGMCYLHSLSPPIIHGDLKPQNVLLNENLTAKICDFGFVQLNEYSQSHSCEKVRQGTIAYIPPEAWKDPSLRKTEQFDVYSIGICLWEILTGNKPFEIMIPSLIRELILNNTRPDLTMISGDIPRKITELICQCWDHYARNRPTCAQIKITIEEEMDSLRNKSSEYFQNNDESLDLMREVCSNGIHLIQKSDLIMLSELGKNTLLCTYEEHEFSHDAVAKKVSHLCGTIDSMKSFIAEATILSTLDHLHVIKFFGLCVAEKLLVFEHVIVGPLDGYLRENSACSIQRITNIMHKVSQGMAYLERNRIVHCYLKASNILLGSGSTAKIANFCYSRIVPKDSSRCLIEEIELLTHAKWMAPECHSLRQFYFKSDSWSFGIVLWEAFSYGGLPYDGMDDCEMLNMLSNGGRLEKPMNCPDGLYQVMLGCWDTLVENRPSFQQISLLIRDILFQKSIVEFVPISGEVVSATENQRRINRIKPIGYVPVPLEDCLVSEVETDSLELITIIKRGMFSQVSVF